MRTLIIGLLLCTAAAAHAQREAAVAAIEAIPPGKIDPADVVNEPVEIALDEADAAEVQAAFAAAYGYRATIDDPENPGEIVKNPETPAAFMQRKIQDYVSDIVRAYRVQQATDTARDAALAQPLPELRVGK